MATSAPAQRRGPKVKGPNGIPRSVLIAAKVDPIEKGTIDEALRRRGLPANSTGLRELLLALISADDHAAAA